jgi:hypothetical protein
VFACTRSVRLHDPCLKVRCRGSVDLGLFVLIGAMCVLPVTMCVPGRCALTISNRTALVALVKHMFACPVMFRVRCRVGAVRRLRGVCVRPYVRACVWGGGVELVSIRAGPSAPHIPRTESGWQLLPLLGTSIRVNES